MPVGKKSSSARSFDLRVSLLDIDPEIWRSIRVPHDIRLDRLHQVLQGAFGWTNSHLHQFVAYHGNRERCIGNVQGAERAGFAANLPDTEDERSCLLADVLDQPGESLVYEYDFGDDWRHAVVLTTVHPQTTRLASALCLDGARACPPEDCGGPAGYENYLAVIADPDDPEHESMIEWNGPGFHAEKFDLSKSNRAVSRIKV